MVSFETSIDFRERSLLNGDGLGVQDKQPFVTKAAQKKAEYDRIIASYKQKQVQWSFGQHSVLRCLTVVDDGDSIEMLRVDLVLIPYSVVCKWITGERRG